MVLISCWIDLEKSYSWVEVENAAGRDTHKVTAAHGKGPPALSLAEEFELLAPEEFAQTGDVGTYGMIMYMCFLPLLEMQQILEQRDEAVHEKYVPVFVS